MRWIKAYPTLLRAFWARSLEYRGQSIIWILSGILPLIMMMVWLAIADQQAGPVAGYDQAGFISYYLAVIFLRRMIGVWIIWDLDRDIRLGSLSPQLLRPIDPVHMHLTRMLALRPLQVIIVGPPIALAAWLLGARYDWSLTAVFFVVVTVFGALLIEFFAQMVIGALGFWMTQALAVVNAWFYLRSLFSGWIVPIDLFPPTITAALVYLPFRYMLSFPVEIALGRLSLAQIGQGLLTQYSWALAFFIVYRLLWRRGLRRYGAVGA